MKTLSDGSIVTAKSYYFLLDWNEINEKKFIIDNYNKIRLCDLDREEYMILWLNATTDEYNKMCGLANSL